MTPSPRAWSAGSAADSSSSSSSLSGSGSGSDGAANSASTADKQPNAHATTTATDEGPTPLTLVDLEPGGSCEWAPPRTATVGACPRRRSCRSCLRTRGCMVDERARCVPFDAERKGPPVMASRDDVARALNASRIAAAAIARWRFPAGVVAYCDAVDPACRDCQASDFGRSAGLGPDSRFCVGRGGCVCVDNCEAAEASGAWSRVDPERCPYASTMPKLRPSGLGTEQPQRNNLEPVFLFTLAVLVVVLVITVIRGQERRGPEGWRIGSSSSRPGVSGQSQRSSTNASTSGSRGLQLSLGAWNASRQELMAKEPRDQLTDLVLEPPSALLSPGRWSAVEKDALSPPYPYRSAWSMESTPSATSIESLGR